MAAGTIAAAAVGVVGSTIAHHCETAAAAGPAALSPRPAEPQLQPPSGTSLVGVHVGPLEPCTSAASPATPGSATTPLGADAGTTSTGVGTLAGGAVAPDVHVGVRAMSPLPHGLSPSAGSGCPPLPVSASSPIIGAVSDAAGGGNSSSSSCSSVSSNATVLCSGGSSSSNGSGNSGCTGQQAASLPLHVHVLPTEGGVGVAETGPASAGTTAIAAAGGGSAEPDPAESSSSPVDGASAASASTDEPSNVSRSVSAESTATRPASTPTPTGAGGHTPALGALHRNGFPPSPASSSSTSTETSTGAIVGSLAAGPGQQTGTGSSNGNAAIVAASAAASTAADVSFAGYPPPDAKRLALDPEQFGRTGTPGHPHLHPLFSPSAAVSAGGQTTKPAPIATSAAVNSQLPAATSDHLLLQVS